MADPLETESELHDSFERIVRRIDALKAERDALRAELEHHKLPEQRLFPAAPPLTVVEAMGTDVINLYRLIGDMATTGPWRAYPRTAEMRRIVNSLCDHFLQLRDVLSQESAK